MTNIDQSMLKGYIMNRTPIQKVFYYWRRVSNDFITKLIATLPQDLARGVPEWPFLAMLVALHFTPVSE